MSNQWLHEVCHTLIERYVKDLGGISEQDAYVCRCHHAAPRSCTFHLLGSILLYTVKRIPLDTHNDVAFRRN